MVPKLHGKDTLKDPALMPTGLVATAKALAASAKDLAITTRVQLLMAKALEDLVNLSFTAHGQLQKLSTLKLLKQVLRLSEAHPP